jgi:hypothetical protein
MAFRDRIEVVIDFVTDPAKKGLAQLKTDVAAADGVMGKAKAGAAGLGTALSAYAAPAALAAGAAFFEFARRSVTAFQDTALAAADFSDAVGVTIEDASRWIAVGDDVGISADSIQASFMRMNRAISAGTFDKYAIDVKRAADGTVDANATFQSAITTIGAIPDATERAKVAQEVFGRGYASIARLMEMDAKSLADALGSVSDEQIIDEEERQKAYELQAAMDDLQDAGERLMLALGEGLVPALADLASGAADVIGVVSDLNNVMNGTLFESPLGGLVDLITGSDEAAESLDETTEASRDVDAAMGPMARSMDDAASSSRNLRDEQERLYDSVISIADGKRAFEAAMDSYTDSLAELGGTMMDVESTSEDVEDATRSAADAAIDAAKKYATLEGAALNSKDGHRRLVDSLQLMVDSLAEGSPLRRSLEEHIAILKDIPDEINTDVRVRYIADGNVVVDENGNVRIRPGGRSAVSGQSVPVAPTMPVMPESGSQAWFAMNEAAFAAGQTLEEYWQSQLDAFDQAAEIYENQYEMQQVEARDYRAFLLEKQKATVQYSDEWMAIQRDIDRVNERIRQERKDARRDEREESRDARDDARAEAEAMYELAQARQNLKDANADFLKVINDPEASDSDKDDAGRSYASSIVAHLAARAAALGMKSFGVRWARFMRKRIEKQITKQAAYPPVVKWLKIELLRIPDFSDIDDNETADDPAGGSTPAPGSGAAEPGAPATRPAPRPGSRQATPGVSITVNAGLGADGQQIGREVVKALRNYQLANGPLPIRVA